MTVDISSDAEEDLIEGYWFYERQSPGLGDYFRSCLIADQYHRLILLEHADSPKATFVRTASTADK